MKQSLIFVVLSVLRAQGTDFNFSPHDCLLDASGAPTATLPCTVPYADPTMPYPSLRYGYGGAALAYNFTFPNGPAFVTLSFSEPNKTATGQRLFTYRVNNLPPVQIDVFKLSGGLKKKLDITIPLMITDGTLSISFTSQVGNVIINKIEVIQMFSDLLTWLSCSARPECVNLSYIKLKKPNGSIVELYAIPIDAQYNSANFMNQIFP